MESLRNSFALLRGHLHSFLIAHLAFDDAPYDADAVVDFWQTLGVGVDMLDKACPLIVLQQYA